LTRIIFIFWMMAITVLSIVPHQDDSIIEKSNITESGMEKHFIAYFIAAFLCYYAFDKKEDGGQRSEVGSQRSEVTFIWMSGLLIFLYGAVLEIIQFFLPYRTFNVKDVVANTSGIILFVVTWSLYLQISMRKKNAKAMPIIH